MTTEPVKQTAAVRRAKETLSGPASYFTPGAVESWFLGPKAENAEEFEKLVVEAIRDHVFWRRNFHPDDPSHINEETKNSAEYLAGMGNLKEQFRMMLGMLKKSVPFFSMRYQGHMNWDLTLPSVLGYFAAMLYNSNNVAFEASTTTTLMEITVGDELCKMLGYGLRKDEPIRPWGHITSGGTVANIEAVWAARNLKWWPVSLQAALGSEESLKAAAKLEVTTPKGDAAKLLGADLWTAMNLDVDGILDLPRRLEEEFGISRQTLTDAINAHSVQSLGWHEFSRRYLGGLKASPVFLTPGTKHYSWPKAAAVLGLGASNLVNVPVDPDARQDVDALDSLLKGFLDEQRPVYEVVVVVGSTEESAIDSVEDVLELREKYRAQGLDFPIHTDAAWGGYFASLIRTDAEMGDRVEFTKEITPSLSAYSARQLAAMGKTDSITIDPHKSGYIPYPAGALCYRNSAMRDLVTFSAPVIFHGDAEPTVGIYGIEGSKPGAAAASVYLSHRVVRPTQSGYGRIMAQALFACEKLYVRLLTMFGEDDQFFVVPVSRLPAEVAGKDIAKDLKFMKERIDRQTYDEILQDKEARDFLAELGPDLNIIAYAFNFKDKAGKVNTNLEMTNRLNQAIYDRLSINPGEDIYGYDLILSTTAIDAADYGEQFVEGYKKRLGLKGAGKRVTILRSVVLDPWVAETPGGSFVNVLEDLYRRTAAEALAEIEA
ncbi:MAG TPA: pyridoxal-dependent decarboxylase [Actinomycetota bacterium]|nr:pyridoxal-dependent decarboxylase [Actinomycetota bacterium]